MKKLLLFLLLPLLLLTGCAKREASEQPPQLILRYADNQPEDYPTTKAAEYFAQLVKERTHGKIIVRVYCDGELGTEESVFEQVQFGGIDFARVSLATLSTYYPNAEVLLLPYLYDDAEHMWRVLDGSIGKAFLAGTRQVNIIGLSWFDAGARSFYTREPITHLEDLSGLSIRVQESSIMTRMVHLLGASPVQISYGDVYSALQTARIDGAENNWPSYQSTGHFEAAPYFLRDEHTRMPEMQFCSTVALDKIAAVDEDYVTIVQECARLSALYERELWSQQEIQAELDLMSMGCTVTELEAAELSKFRQAVLPLYEAYPDEMQTMIAKIQQS